MRVSAHPSPKYATGTVRNIGGIPAVVRKAINECTTGVAPWPLFVFGPAGSGKTCAGLCLCDHVSGSLYWTEETLVQDATDSMMGRLFNSLGFETYPQSFWRHASAAPFVLVDELGARNVVSDHRYSVVKSMLDIRDCKPLMLVSNVEPKELSKVYDDRIASRALCGTVVKAGGDDRRLKR